MVDIASPLELPQGQRLKNRLAKSATSEQLGDAQNAPSKALIELYQRWARGGAGLLITGNVMVDGRARTEPDNVILEDEGHLDAFKAWAGETRSAGAEIWMQINHPGRQVLRTVSDEPVAPSAVPLKGFGPLFAPPRALTEAEIQETIERFARSAASAERAGFSGVQIHAAHGYLISQFLSPLTNLREDVWGGPIEHRMAFLLAVTRAVKSAVSADFPVGIKLNSADFQRGGLTQEESMQVVDALNEEGIALLEISGGTYERTEMWRQSQSQASASTLAREAYFLEYAEQVRERVKVPLMLTGGMRSRAFMDQTLAAGAVDLIGMARPLIVEPDLPERLLSNTAQQAVEHRVTFGIKSIDAVIQSTWYGLQIKRIAAGKPTKPRLSRLYAFAYGLAKNMPIGAPKVARRSLESPETAVSKT